MGLSGYELDGEPCGFAIDKNDFVLGATPNDKVVVDGEFGFLEVKCSEDTIMLIQKIFTLYQRIHLFLYGETSCKILVNKSHTYYDQIQMQLALTKQSWCDLIFYTSTGLIIHRLQFDETHWHKLQTKILNLYFEYMLDKLINF